MRSLLSSPPTSRRISPTRDTLYCLTRYDSDGQPLLEPRHRAVLTPNHSFSLTLNLLVTLRQTPVLYAWEVYPFGGDAILTLPIQDLPNFSVVLSSNR